MQEPTVVRTRATAPEDPASQIAWIQAGTGAYSHYSHNEELPFRLLLPKRGKWWQWCCRKPLLVKTTELVWYRDAVTYIEIPAGFKSDLASIPRPLWWILATPWDIALEALFHDLFYQEQVVKRRVADQTLLSMMEDRNVPWVIRWTVYFGVRLGGWVAWWIHAWEKHKAELAAQAASAQKDGEP